MQINPTILLLLHYVQSWRLEYTYVHDLNIYKELL